MGDPDLHSDEVIILKTPNVFVKSIPFEAILTNQRIILVDRKKDLIPPKDILLATVRDIEAGENAIRDQTVNLSIITTTGETRQVVLTFSREAGGNRKRERDEWTKVLKQYTSSSFQQAIRKVVPLSDQEPRPKPAQVPAPKIEITSRPQTKKEVDAVQPIKKILETSNAPPKPVETTSLPQGSFCSKCGNRVPADSVFCNRCGAKIILPGFEMAAEPAAQKVPQFSVTYPLKPEVTLTVQNVPPHLPTVTSEQLEKKERPIEDVIRSIEPLIEGSVPRTEPAPLVQPAATPIESVMPTVPAVEQVAIPQVSATPEATPATTAPPRPENPRSIFPQLFLKKDTPQQSAPAGVPPAALPPQGPPMAGPGGKTYITIALLAIFIIAVAGGAFLYMKNIGGTPSDNATSINTTPTTLQSTTKPTTLPTTRPPVIISIPTTPPSPVIPPTGVWVKVNYIGGWKGSYGAPGSMLQVTNTSVPLYRVPVKDDGIVQVSFQKLDGSGNALVVEVYKNGALVKSGRTTTPKGIVEFLVDLKPPTTAVPTATQTAVNATATQTPKPTTPAGNVTTVKTTAPVTTATTRL